MGQRRPGQTKKVKGPDYQIPPEWIELMTLARSIRAEKKIPVDAVAAELGVDRRTLSYWENATRAAPHPHDLILYFKAIGVRVVLEDIE
jgi:transcriptional regulator with XRE-family HTH domain